MDAFFSLINELLPSLSAKFPIITLILTLLGALVLIGQMIILATPGKDDDKKLQDFLAKPLYKKLFDFLMSFAPFTKNGLNKKD